jgi:hypothetical protein
VSSFISAFHVQDSQVYSQNVHKLIKEWVASPNEHNYRNLDFYLRHNKPNEAINPVTEKALLKKLDANTLSNQSFKKAAIGCVLVGTCIVVQPESCGCALIGCAMMSGNLLRTCHQDNKKYLIDELKSCITDVCATSRKIPLFPQPQLMKKSEDEAS